MNRRDKKVYSRTCFFSDLSFKLLKMNEGDENLLRSFTTRIKWIKIQFHYMIIRAKRKDI